MPDQRRIASRRRAGVGDWSDDPSQTGYGCFLPDLTGLPGGSSAASLPGRSIVFTRRGHKGRARVPEGRGELASHAGQMLGFP